MSSFCTYAQIRFFKNNFLARVNGYEKFFHMVFKSYSSAGLVPLASAEVVLTPMGLQANEFLFPVKF